MTNFAWPPRQPVSIPVIGTDMHFPLGRIFCVGRNYAAHAREMGKDPDREPPFFFCKDADAWCGDDATIPYPSSTEDYQHEVELVVAVGADGKDIAARDYEPHVFGYAVGLDMTRRDLQMAARDLGRPWDTGKNLPLSAPTSAIRRASDIGSIENSGIVLAVNGVVRQQSMLQDMIWNVGEIFEHLSRLYTLRAGDLIFTGTPAGVGAVRPGDVLEGSIDRVGTLCVTIGQS